MSSPEFSPPALLFAPLTETFSQIPQHIRMEKTPHKSENARAEQVAQPQIGAGRIDKIPVFHPYPGFAQGYAIPVRDNPCSEGVGEKGPDVEVVIAFDHDNVGARFFKSAQFVEQGQIGTVNAVAKPDPEFENISEQNQSADSTAILFQKTEQAYIVFI